MGYGGAPDLSAYAQASSLSTYASDAELAAAIASKADAAALPAPSDSSPYGCGVANAGTAAQFARYDHVHAPFAYSDAYRDTGQTVNLQTITLRSIPIPAGGNYAFDVVILGTNAAQTLAGRIAITGSVVRGSILLRTLPTLVTSTTLSGILADIAANTGANTADIKVTGIAAQTINWKCWTIVRRNA